MGKDCAELMRYDAMPGVNTGHVSENNELMPHNSMLQIRPLQEERCVRPLVN